ncbi:MAG: helix-turn-helix transcriptional regulator [Bacteroidetes bacterium]|nr:helix-turn-helix transcriptional regulator [Bacteroidota bacterium]
MKDIANNMLHALTKAGAVNVSVEPAAYGRGLPRFLVGLYEQYSIMLGEERWLGVYAKHPEELRPAQYEKHTVLLKGSECAGVVLIAETLPYYIRERLIARGLAFIVPELQMYWPEFGLSLKRHYRRSRPRPVEAFSPMTQLLALQMLNGHVAAPLSVTEISDLLECSSMSASRALNELHANGIIDVLRKGRERLLLPPADLAALWERVRPFMRDPRKKTVIVWEDEVPAANRIPAGESALAAMSMLNPPEFPVYAVAPLIWRVLHEKGVRQLSVADDGACSLQIWRYDPAPVAALNHVDVFSLYLSLQDEADERIQSACEEMMKLRSR